MILTYLLFLLFNFVYGRRYPESVTVLNKFWYLHIPNEQNINIFNVDRSSFVFLTRNEFFSTQDTNYYKIFKKKHDSVNTCDQNDLQCNYYSNNRSYNNNCININVIHTSVMHKYFFLPRTSRGRIRWFTPGWYHIEARLIWNILFKFRIVSHTR